ncbi:MAG TPA: PQQ-binding-like beta-propeller repeat protein [Opitutaceae bacterium]|nr:PQQ-binding-like beta-propeller repeat protein [Opitutaceae bacterium]
MPTAPAQRWTDLWRLLARAAAAALAGSAVAAPFGPGFSAKELTQGYREGVVLAKPRAGNLPTIDRVERGEGMSPRAEFARFGHVRVLRLAPGDSVMAAVARLRATGRYEYVEPDYIRRTTAVPKDPRFASQWGLNNTGSNAGGGGLAGADIHAEAGWDTLSSAGAVIVGILDSGALLSHQDLAANLWTNPSPYTKKSYATQDANGNSEMISETDDVNGLNTVQMTGPPTDTAGHGTHVSGIVGAVGSNSLGVCGVAWSVQLMELEFIDGTGAGSTTAELPCIEYAIAHGAGVLSASFGSQSFSQAEMDAIQSAGKAGIIFVCAAGNSAEDNDISPFFPADYPLDNIIAVGASDNRDRPVYFTNYGSGSVDIFAPGENILSTYNSSASSYAYLSGTSMATPFVSGVVALLRAKYPGDTYRETINRVLNGADRVPGLAGKAQTGGRLDLAAALAAANTPPNALFASRTVLIGLDPYTKTSNADSPSALEGGTPAIPGATSPGHSLWWQWTAPENASVEIDTSGTQGGALFTGGSSYSTALGVYTGTSLGSLATVATNAAYGTEPLEGSPGTLVPYSEVKFEAAAGTTYVINVEGQAGASGQTVLAINTDPDYDSLAAPRVLSGPSVAVLDANSNATLEGGEPRILTYPGGHSLWYSWTAPFSGTAQVSGYSYDFNPEVAVYTGSSYGNLSPVVAAAAPGTAGTTTVASQCLCTFTAAAGTAYLIKVDGETSSDTGEFTLSIADSKWQAQTGDAVTCSPAVGPDGTVYVGSGDSKFYAFNADGSVKWSYTSGGIFDTSAAAVGPDGTVFAGGTDGNVYAFDPSNGSLRWIYTIPTPPSGSGLDNGLSSSPAVGADGTVYIHADDGNLYALGSGGSPKWTFPVAGVSYAAPTIAPDGTVYIGTDGGLLYAVDPAGTQKWVFNAPVSGESIYTAVAIDSQGNLYFGTLTGNFYSVTPAGALRWAYAVGDGVTSAPALANGQVYFGGYDGNLYALTTSGSLAWRYNLGTQVRASAPAVDANGVVYIGCYDHNVYAVGPGGSLVRIYASDDIIRSSPAIAGTTLYFGSEDHKVYAFGIGAGPAASDWPMYQYNGQRPGRAVSSVLEITAQPSGQAVGTGSPFSLTVGASGPGTLTYQWYLDGAAIAGAVNATYSVAAAAASDGGTYTVTVASGSSNVASAPAVVTVGAAAPGRIVNLSARADVGTGGNILIAGFVISGSGSKAVVLRGVGPTLGTAPFNVSGVLAQPQLTLVNTGTQATVFQGTAWGGSSALANEFAAVGAFALPAGSADAAVLETLGAGSYTSEIAGVNSATGVALAEIYDAQPGSTASSLINLSARANVGSGANILIAGFVIQGSQPAKVLLRGVGPALGGAPFNLTGVLAQPRIQLYNSAQSVIQSNAGWAGDPALSAAFTQVGAFPLPASSADAAMIATLPAGSYTLQLSGASGTTGVGLAEIYLIP